MPQAVMLINNGADTKLAGNDGLSPVDIAFAQNIEPVKTALRTLADSKQKSEQLNRSSSEERLAEMRRSSNMPNGELLKVHEIETLADTTMLSGMSEILQSIDVANCDDKISLKIRALHEKSLAAQKRVDKLRRRNNELSRRVKSKEASKSKCVDTADMGKDSTTAMMHTLTNEIEAYTNYIDSYRRASQPFFDDIFNLMLSKLRAHFGDSVNVTESGSYENGLVMPWSDLNMVVTFPSDNRSEMRNRNVVIENTKKFSKVMQMERKLVQNCFVEERASLLILKIRLTKAYRQQNVEIMFKYYVNPSYPSNEEIVMDYLDKYDKAKPLYIVFRTILHHARLDDPAVAGLKSAVIFFMIIAYLQHAEATSDKPLRSMSIGELFLSFLFFYSYGFDYFNECIQSYAVGDAHTETIMQKDPHRRINSLMVLNPYNDDIILTKSFKRTAELKQLLRLCYISLFNTCACANNKTINLKPKLALRSSSKKQAQEEVSDLYERALEGFKIMEIRYMGGSAQKKLTKMSMHIEPEKIEQAPRTSFAVPQLAIQNLLDDEHVLYRYINADSGPCYMLHKLFSFNFSSCVNI